MHREKIWRISCLEPDFYVIIRWINASFFNLSHPNEDPVSKRKQVSASDFIAPHGRKVKRSLPIDIIAIDVSPTIDQIGDDAPLFVHVILVQECRQTSASHLMSSEINLNN